MIAAVVVTYSAPADVLDRCLRALVGEPGLDEVIVVDTGGAATVAADLSDEVSLHQVANRGYGAAANGGFELARRAGATRFLLLNDDVVVQRGFLAPLIAELESSSAVGVVQPMIVDSAGTRVVSLGVELDSMGAGHDIADGEPVPESSLPSDLAIFTGGAVLMTADFVWSAGGFDERFFLYYEDVDLALHGSSLGWRYRLVPDSIVSHERGTSTAALGDETRYLQERNRLWTAIRYGTPATKASAFGLSVRRLRFPPRRVHARALADGLTKARRRSGGLV